MPIKIYRNSFPGARSIIIQYPCISQEKKLLTLMARAVLLHLQNEYYGKYSSKVWLNQSSDIIQSITENVFFLIFTAPKEEKQLVKNSSLFRPGAGLGDGVGCSEHPFPYLVKVLFQSWKKSVLDLKSTLKGVLNCINKAWIL